MNSTVKFINAFLVAFFLVAFFFVVVVIGILSWQINKLEKANKNLSKELVSKKREINILQSKYQLLDEKFKIYKRADTLTWSIMLDDYRNRYGTK